MTTCNWVVKAPYLMKDIEDVVHIVRITPDMAVHKEVSTAAMSYDVNGVDIINNNSSDKKRCNITLDMNVLTSQQHRDIYNDSDVVVLAICIISDCIKHAEVYRHDDTASAMNYLGTASNCSCEHCNKLHSNSNVKSIMVDVTDGKTSSGKNVVLKLVGGLEKETIRFYSISIAVTTMNRHDKHTISMDRVRGLIGDMSLSKGAVDLMRTMEARERGDVNSGGGGLEGLLSMGMKLLASGSRSGSLDSAASATDTATDTDTSLKEQTLDAHNNTSVLQAATAAVHTENTTMETRLMRYIDSVVASSEKRIQSRLDSIVELLRHEKSTSQQQQQEEHKAKTILQESLD